jgi:imidazole glycerol phosphate synthase subunit HisF
MDLRELTVDIDGVQTRDEINEHIVDSLGDFAEQGLCDFSIGWVFRQVHRNEELLSFGVDITNVNSTLVSKEDNIALFAMVSMRVYSVHVELRLRD